MLTVSIASIKKARENIQENIHYTPMLHSNFFSKETGSSIFFKSENMQKTGAFKIRGALNRVTNVVNSNQKVSGFVTASSGNHGQAVAYSAALMGMPATVVLPEDASMAKVKAIRGYGAKTAFSTNVSNDRLAMAQKIADEENLLFIPPYDNEDVISGQGTIGLEILEQIHDVDVVLVPVGGGGLISGISTAIKEIKPSVKVFGVEPVQSNSMYLSLKAGEITPAEKIQTIADGVRTKQPGKLTFPIVQKYVDDIILVKEEEIIKSVYLLMERQKIVVEPTGAVSLAATLSGRFPGQKVACVLSGGNVDLVQLANMILEFKNSQ